MTDVRELYRRAAEGFGARVHAVGDDQWSRPTPCAGWDVRTLVNHLVYEDRWAVPLLEGRTVEEVGDTFEGDLLGGDPVGMWDDAVAAATAAVHDGGTLDRTVYLSFGPTPATEYVLQLFADHLIHAWDLARGIGADDRLDPALVEACAQWFDEQEAAYRDSGAVGPRVGVPGDADPQTRLLARFGRRA